MGFLDWAASGMLPRPKGPPRCGDCGLFVPPDDPDLLCVDCKILRLEAKERAEREARERAEREAPDDPVHRDG